MKKALCLVQKHMFSKEDIQRLEVGIKNIYQRHYSNEKVNMLWMVMPKGYAYSERKPSNASVIMVEVDNDITQAKREELMGLISRFLLDNFEISPLDSVITVANSSFVNAFFEAQRKRIHPLYRPWITLKMMTTALLSKFTQGYLRLRVKY